MFADYRLRWVIVSLLGLTEIVVIAFLFLFAAKHPPRAAQASPQQHADVGMLPDGGPGATWQGTINGVYTWLTVIPRGHTISDRMRQEEPWWRWGNTTTDTYVFAFQNFNNVRMVLSFDLDRNGLPEARVFVNDYGRKPLDLTQKNGRLVVRSNNGYPTLILRPDGGGWTIDGHTNYNLTETIYGEPQGLPVKLGVPPGTASEVIRVGSQHPGVPDWEVKRLLYDPYPNSSIPRFAITLRLPDAPPFRTSVPTLPDFPYLGIGNQPPDWSEINPNPLYFDVARPELEILSFPSFEIGGTYAINSVTMPPNVDFESPFGFYRFDPTRRYSQLVVRAQSFPIGDKFDPVPTERFRSSFRYSWSGTDSATWAYSIDVAGFHAYTDTVHVGNTAFHGIPPDELPQWVASKVWPFVTFVEATKGYPGAEGIYFYSAQDPIAMSWLSGLTSTPPAYLTEPYLPSDTTLTKLSTESLPPSFHGEFIANDEHPPILYLSPIDNRLHLLGARGGVWNLGHSLVLRLHNLDGGPYINGWTLERVPPQPQTNEPPRALPGHVEQALYAIGGYLVYGGHDEVQLAAASYAPEIFRTSPPTDRESWQRLRNRLASDTGETRDPRALSTWIEDIPDSNTSPWTWQAAHRLTIHGARLSDFRATANGFRFVLAVQDGYSLEGVIFAPLRGLTPGQYVVSYNGKFTVEPLSPPDISLSVQATTDGQRLVSDPVTVKVEITNVGRADLKGATLSIVAQHDGQRIQIARKGIDVLAGGSVRQIFPWQHPADEAAWKIETHVKSASGVTMAQASQTVRLPPPDQNGASAVLNLSTIERQQPTLLFLLGTVAILALTIPWMIRQ